MFVLRDLDFAETTVHSVGTTEVSYRFGRAQCDTRRRLLLKYTNMIFSILMFPVLYFFYRISWFLFIFSSSLWSSVRRLLSLCANQGGSRGLLKSRTWVSDRSSPPSHFFLRRSPFFLGGCFDRLGRWCVTPLRLTLPEHPPPTLHTIHTSLPLTVGGSRQRPALTPTTPSSKDSTQNATPLFHLLLLECL